LKQGNKLKLNYHQIIHGNLIYLLKLSGGEKENRFLVATFLLAILINLISD